MPAFPDTRESLVRLLGSVEQTETLRAFEVVVRVYRRPVITLLQHKWSLEQEDAEDLAQDFFAQALEKHWLSRFDASRGRFRTFLRSCVVAFAATAHQASHRLKRGGDATHVPLDELIVADAAAPGDVDELFEREWIRSVLTLSLAALGRDSAREGKETALRLFHRYDVDSDEKNDRPTYADLAREFAIPATQVTNHLAWARRRFRVHVLNTIRELAGSEEEYRSDVRTLLGSEP